MKKLFLLIMLFFLFKSTAQTIGIYQDVALAAYETSHELQPFTADVLAQVQFKYSRDSPDYFTYTPTFEYANLHTYGYYGVTLLNVGYTIQPTSIKNVTLNTMIGHWMIYRNKFSFSSFINTYSINYTKNKIGFNLLAQIVDRKDLLLPNFTDRIRVSGFFGVSYKFNS